MEFSQLKMDKIYVVVGICFVLFQLRIVSTDHIVVQDETPKLSEFHQARVKVQQLKPPSDTTKSALNDVANKPIIESQKDSTGTRVKESPEMKTSLGSDQTNQFEYNDVVRIHPPPAEAYLALMSLPGVDHTNQYGHNDVAHSHAALDEASALLSTFGLDQTNHFGHNDQTHSHPASVEESSALMNPRDVDQTNHLEHNGQAHSQPATAEASSTLMSSLSSGKAILLEYKDHKQANGVVESSQAPANAPSPMKRSRGTDQTSHIEYNDLYPINDMAKSHQVPTKSQVAMNSSVGREQTSQFEYADYHQIKDVAQTQQEQRTLSMNTQAQLGRPNEDKNGIKKNTITDFVGHSVDSLEVLEPRVSETPFQNRPDINTDYHIVNDQPKVFNVPMSEYVGQNTVSEKLDTGVSSTEGSKWQNLVYKLLTHIMDGEKPKNVDSAPQTEDKNSPPNTAIDKLIRPMKATSRNDELSQKLFGIENNGVQLSHQLMPAKEHKETPASSYHVKTSINNREKPIFQHRNADTKNEVQRKFGILSPIIFVLTGDKCNDASHKHNAKVGSTRSENLYATVKESIEPLLGHAKDVKMKKKPVTTTPRATNEPFEALVDATVEEIHDHRHVHHPQTTTPVPILVLNKDYGRDVTVPSPTNLMKAKRMKLQESHQPNTRSASLIQRMPAETEVKPEFHSSQQRQTNIATDRLYTNEPNGMHEIVVQTLSDVGNGQRTQENTNVVVTKVNRLNDNRDVSRTFEHTYDTRTVVTPRRQNIKTDNDVSSSVRGNERRHPNQVDVDRSIRRNVPLVSARNEAARPTRTTSRIQDVSKTQQSPEQRRAGTVRNRNAFNSQSSPNRMVNKARQGPTVRFQRYRPHMTRTESNSSSVRRPTHSMSRRTGGPQVRTPDGSNRSQSGGSVNRRPESPNKRQFSGPRSQRPSSQNNRLSVDVPGRLSASPKPRQHNMRPHVRRPSVENSRPSERRSFRGPIMPDGQPARLSSRSNAHQSVQRPGTPRNRQYEGPFRPSRSNYRPKRVQSAKDVFNQNNRLPN